MTNESTTKRRGRPPGPAKPKPEPGKRGPSKGSTYERPYTVLCEGCGIPFAAARPDARFHSDACQLKHWRAQKKAAAAAEAPGDA